ncbi:ABC transporter ATP-binding protein [Candidatus Kaiserbacteria bacterium]|nr:ABC transporter ATP-binding protein [Candidatus Kaiserbacteria bacterium]
MRNAIEVKDLRKRYDKGVEALKGVTLTVGEGDFFALLGPNGAGKTTLIGILTGLVYKTGGSAAIFGHDVTDDSSRAKTYIGLVPQEFNFNIFEKVEDIIITQAGYYGIPRSEALKRVEPILKDLGLWEKRHEPSQKLSGGMKRRLMIARALIHHPKLLILDEPTAGVDVELRRQMWTFLRKINAEGTTIVLTTHYLEEAEQLARNVAIINKGEILVNEPMQGFLERHENKKLEDIYISLIEGEHNDKQL